MPGAVRHAAARHEAAAEDAVIPAIHCFQESGEILRPVAETSIHLENIIVPRSDGFPVSTHVGVDDAAVLRSPHDFHTRLAGRQLLHHLSRATARSTAQPRIKPYLS